MTATRDMQTRLRLHQVALSKGDSQPHPSWKEALECLSREVDQFFEKEAAVRSDGQLTAEGQRRKIADLVRGIDLTWLRRMHDDLTAAVGRAEALVYQPLPNAKGNEVVAFFREQEIRSQLRQE